MSDTARQSLGSIELESTKSRLLLRALRLPTNHNLYARFFDKYLIKQTEDRYYTIRRLVLPAHDEILLCVVHFPSKLYQNPNDQRFIAAEFGKILASIEEQVGHSRTLLVGDLNMNPYEDGLVEAGCLHAVTTRRIAERGSRVVSGLKSNPHFYNPMWSHFGEREEGHAGTYYFSRPKARADFWNIYDQVLLRPELLPYFRNESLKILHEDEATMIPFITREGYPNGEIVSDHLPILFCLDIEPKE